MPARVPARVPAAALRERLLERGRISRVRHGDEGWCEAARDECRTLLSRRSGPFVAASSTIHRRREAPFALSIWPAFASPYWLQDNAGWCSVPRVRAFHDVIGQKSSSSAGSS